MNDLNKIILKLLYIVKKNKLEKVNKTSLVKYLFFLDYFYAKKHKKQFSNIDWRMNYYGPHSFEIDDILDELVKNKKVNLYYGENKQHIYYLSDSVYFNNFEINEIKDIEYDWENIIKEYQEKRDLKALLQKTYSTEAVEGKKLGDKINFEKVDFVNFKEDIKPIKNYITDKEKIKRLKELAAKIKNKPLRESNYKFLNPALIAEDNFIEDYNDNFPNISKMDITYE